MFEVKGRWSLLYEQLNVLLVEVATGDAEAHEELDNLIEEVARMHTKVLRYLEQRQARQLR